MANIAAVAEQLILSKLMSGSTALSASNKAVRDLAILSGFFAAVGLGFLIFAAYLWLQAHYTPDIAAAATGALAIITALVIACFALGIIHYRQSGIKKLRREIRETMHEAMESLEDLLEEPVNQNPKTAVLGASVAGFMAGERFL